MAGRGNAVVPEGWRAVRLGDVAEVVGGSTPSRTRADYWGEGVPWVTPSELTELPGRYLESSQESITRDGLKAAGLRVLPAGSVLLTTRATIGATAINVLPVTTNQGFQNLVGRAETESLWLYYCVSWMRHELEKRGAGSTFREVSRDSVRTLPILLPPLPEQRAIAAVLDSIDEAIERTEEVIAATERLRDALLHELLTRGLPGYHAAWREVPGLGTIPADWDVVRLGDVCREPIKNGFSTRAADEPTGWWLLTLAAVSHDGFVPGARKPAPVDHRVQAYQLTTGDLLVSRSNTSDRVGLAGVYRGVPDRCSYPDLLMRVRLDTTRALAEVVEANLLSGRGRTYFQRNARGTSGSMVKITSQILRGFLLALPSLAEQRAIAAALDSVDASIERARAELAALQSSKASTADSLLTGRVRVDPSRESTTACR